jgi:hypothetical protein
VQCDGRVLGGFSDGLYDNGAVSGNPAGALETSLDEYGFTGAQTGYQLARLEDRRVLFIYNLDGVTKQAIIVHDGPTIDRTGWYVGTEAGVEVWPQTTQRLGCA